MKVAYEKPTAAFVLSFLAGVIILLSGIAITVIAGVLTYFLGGVGAVFGLFGVFSGILILVGAIMLYLKPQQHIAWSVVILVFSLVSWVGALGGFIVGFILGLVGGILGLVHNPAGGTMSLRICVKCGRQVTDSAASFCPNCGYDLRTQA